MPRTIDSPPFSDSPSAWAKAARARPIPRRRYPSRCAYSSRSSRDMSRYLSALSIVGSARWTGASRADSRSVWQSPVTFASPSKWTSVGARRDTQRCFERRRYGALGAHIRIGLRRLYGTHSPYISAAEKDVKIHSGCSSASVLTTRVATKRRYSCADQQERSKRPGYGLYTSFASTRRKRAFSTLREFGCRQRRLSSDSLKSLSSSSPHAVCFIWPPPIAAKLTSRASFC